MGNKLEIVWVFEKYVNGGAFTSGLHLYNAFKEYYPEFKQTVYVCPLNSAFKRGKDDWVFPHKVISIKELKNILRYNKEKPKVCFIHKLMHSRVSYYLRGLVKPCPVYVINHSYTRSSVGSKYGICDGIISVSELMKKEQKQRNGVLNHFCIHNSIHEKLLSSSSEYSQVSSDDYFITGRINSLNTIKYSDKWIKFIYSDNFKKPILHDYIGSGAGVKKAKAIIKKNSDHKNKVVMHGLVEDTDEKISIVKTWDIFFYHINRPEGTSMAILEALACGIPVVCSDHHGNNEIIEDGVNGFVFKDFNHAKEIVNDLIENPDRLCGLKKSTLDHYNNKLSSSKWVDKYVDVIKKSYKISKGGQVIKRIGAESKDKIKPYTQFPMSRSGRKIRKKEVKKKKRKTKPAIGSKDKGDKKIKDRDKFTVLSTFFNYKIFIQGWFDSLLLQKHKPFEVIAVDDCSSDGSYKKLKSLVGIARDNDINLIIHRNDKRMYCGSSYLKAFELSSGDYLGILDGDDQLTENAISTIMRQYKKRPKIDYIYTQFAYCDQDMQMSGRKGLCSSPIKGKSLLSSELTKGKRHCYSHWRTFKRIPKIHKIFYKDGKKSVDKFMGYRLEELGNGMFLDRVLYKYRSPHRKSITKVGGQISEWEKIRKEASKRRKRYNLKPMKIITIE